MKYFYTFLLFTVSNTILAQLTIRNNASVFINNQVVFVEDDIALNESGSTIYLRSEGQLVQGDGLTGNSGVGELSVYQEANAGAYEYNYWCSPIGSKINNSVNNPFGISFLNDATGLTTFTPATSISSTSYNGTSSPLNIEPYWVWKFIADDQYSGWVHVQASTNLNPGEGFTMKGTVGSSDAQRYDFRGKPNSGTIAVSVLNNKFTLVGNPYPSALDALAYIHDSENAAVITGTLFFWEQDPSVNSHYLNAYNGGYATYTISSDGSTETFIHAVFNTYNGDGTINISNTGTGSKTPKQYIPIGQGFMVEGIATGTVKAKNSHRVFIKETNSDSEFFKTSSSKESSNNNVIANPFSIIPDDYKRFRLNIDLNDTYTRQIVETFHQTATDGFDYGLEIKINPTELLDSDAYFEANGNTYLAEALPFNIASKIPLNIKVENNMPIRIRIADIQNFDNSQPIYIHDIENDSYIDLKNQDFEISLDAGLYTSRFEITFEKTTLNVSENTFDGLKVFLNNNLSILKIHNPNALQIKSFYLFDISGKRILKRKQLQTEKEYIYSTKPYKTGVYTAKIKLSNGKVFSKKLVIAN